MGVGEAGKAGGEGIMYYCDECRVKRGWPESMCKSRGPCEICGKIASCNDVSSRNLPSPRMGKDFEK